MICFDQNRCLDFAKRIVGQDLYYNGWWTALGHEVDGEIIAAVFFTLGYSEQDIEMHVVAKPGSRWMTSDFARCVFRYPFIQLNMRRVSASAALKPFRRILKVLGFREEGIKRQAVDGQDVAMFGMLREECRYA